MRADTIMEPVQAFGTCLKELLESRRISGSELARMMAYKSRNSIFRILDEECGQSSRQSFFDRLLDEDPLNLDKQERLMLAQAMEVSRVGKPVFLSNHAMREMLMNHDNHERAKAIRVDAFNLPDDPRFERALDEMAHCKTAYVTITGCCDRAVFDALRKQIYKTDVTCEVRMAHIIYTGEEEIVRNISAIQPLLYCDCYRAYCLEPGAFSREREAMYRQNCIYMLMLDENGSWYRQTLMQVDKGVFIPLTRIKSKKNDPMSRYFAEDIRRMPMLKAEMPGSGSVESYLEYIRSCRKLEQGRTIYTIKLDPSLNCIHPDILLPCVKDEFWQMAGDQGETIKMEFVRTHLERFENVFSKKKESHIIFSIEAMQRFAQTGRLSDHFFALRDFLPQERVKILVNLRDQAKKNPGFHMYFFKESFEPPQTEIGLYEGVGTMMTKPYTDYDLSGDHTETIITKKEFCERYKEFYVNDLLKRHVISSEETMALINQLIELAENAS